MCGLNGIFAYRHLAPYPEPRELIATRDHMQARGPDGMGEWWSEDRRLGLGHRRLAILDLSDRGSQPMTSACGRYVIVFNGEIYNYPALRRQIEATGAVFQSHSDTEVLLHLYAMKGADMVHDLRGMYAFAIWDEQTRELFLARDPYGIKPLYYADDGHTFRFASQVKALLAGGQVSREPEPAGVVGYHLWGSVPEPFTLYRGLLALPAGCTLTVSAAGVGTTRAYTRIADILSDGARHPGATQETPARVREAALDSVRAHLLADVEVGLFLSAGVDSGALLGLMRDVGQEKIRAITLAFDEFAQTSEDEAPLAAEIAELYGAQHVVRRIGKAEFQGDLPAILEAMDQPSIDGVNTWLVSKAAREAGLKVVLSGLGGDELLAGYASFREIPRWVNWLRYPSRIPGLGTSARRIAMWLGLARQRPKLAGMLEYGGDYAGAYLLRRGLFLPFELETVLDAELVRSGLERLDVLPHLRSIALAPDPGSPISRVTSLESCCYLRNQLLRDADWAGMAHSLEIRTPLVDVTLLKALAPSIPGLTASDGKEAFAAAPTTPLPTSLVTRRKTGFGVPMGDWLDLPGKARRANKGAASRAWGQEVLSRTIDAEPAFLATRR
jgi:asparagine synthase (glutamine-hydrolysing)